MRILSVIHGREARTELFAPAIAAAGHELDEWSFVWDTPPPQPLESYDAALVFGGAMHADEERKHPWILQELRWLIERHVELTGSVRGAEVLADWEGMLDSIWHIQPKTATRRHEAQAGGRVGASA